MKKNRKKLSFLLAVGLLLMNGLTVVNLILNTHISIDIIDFMKGMGLPIILWSAYHIIKMPAENNGNRCTTP